MPEAIHLLAVSANLELIAQDKLDSKYHYHYPTHSCQAHDYELTQVHYTARLKHHVLKQHFVTVKFNMYRSLNKMEKAKQPPALRQQAKLLQK